MVILIKNTTATPEVIIEGMVHGIPNRHSKNRMIDKLQRMYSEHIEGTAFDATDSTKKIGAFFSKFGLV